MRTRRTLWHTIGLASLCAWAATASLLLAQALAPGPEHKKDEVIWYERLTGTYTKLSGGC